MIAQKSLDLDYNGLMIESHLNPSLALTDKEQQVTPNELVELLNKLKLKSTKSENSHFEKELTKLREQIDFYDDELLSLISNRMSVAKKIGELKSQNEITVLQSNRWNEILNRTIEKSGKLNLGKNFIEKYMEAIHLESIRIQNEDF